MQHDYKDCKEMYNRRQRHPTILQNNYKELRKRQSNYDEKQNNYKLTQQNYVGTQNNYKRKTRTLQKDTKRLQKIQSNYKETKQLRRENITTKRYKMLRHRTATKGKQTHYKETRNNMQNNYEDTKQLHRHQLKALGHQHAERVTDLYRLSASDQYINIVFYSLLHGSNYPQN